MDINILKKRIAAVKFWYFSIELAPGIITPGIGEEHWPKVYSNLYFANISGKSVLDVGAWDGVYSFEARKRGASKVLAVDYFCWGHGGPGDRAGFDLAREIIDPDLEDMIIDIPDISPETTGKFDVVLYNGIFYHVFNPIGHLEVLSKVAKETITLETLMGAGGLAAPAMQYFGGDLKSGVPGSTTHGWGPNLFLLYDVFLHLGFPAIEYIPSPAYPDIRAIILAHRSKSLANQDNLIERNQIPSLQARIRV